MHRSAIRAFTWGGSILAIGILVVTTIYWAHRMSVSDTTSQQPSQIDFGPRPPRFVLSPPTEPTHLPIIPAARATSDIRKEIFTVGAVEALEILRKLPANPETDALIVEYFEYLAAKADWEAIQLAVASLPESAGVNGGVKKACILWAEQEPSGMLAWSSKIESESIRSHIALGLNTYIDRQPSGHTIALINTFLALTDDPVIVRRLYATGAQSLISQGDAKTAADWLLTAKEESTLAADEILVTKAPNEVAQAFLQTLYGSENFDRADRALQRYAETTAVQNPSNAANWAVKIEEETTREKALRSILLSWGLHDANGAAQWIKQKIHGEAQERWLRHISNLPAVTEKADSHLGSDSH